MSALKAGAISALLGALLFGCEDRNPTAPSDGATGADALTGVSATAAGSQSARMRWDIIKIDFATGTVSAGGVANARANDGSRITLTGSGTFNPTGGKLQNVTGGGTWKTFAPDASVTGSGPYQVTGFVSFTLAPGTVPFSERQHWKPGQWPSRFPGCKYLLLRRQQGNTSRELPSGRDA